MHLCAVPAPCLRPVPGLGPPVSARMRVLRGHGFERPSHGCRGCDLRASRVPRGHAGPCCIRQGAAWGGAESSLWWHGPQTDEEPDLWVVTATGSLRVIPWLPVVRNGREAVWRHSGCCDVAGSRQGHGSMWALSLNLAMADVVRMGQTWPGANSAWGRISIRSTSSPVGGAGPESVAQRSFRAWRG